MDKATIIGVNVTTSGNFNYATGLILKDENGNEFDVKFHKSFTYGGSQIHKLGSKIFGLTATYINTGIDKDTLAVIDIEDIDDIVNAYNQKEVGESSLYSFKIVEVVTRRTYGGGKLYKLILDRDGELFEVRAGVTAILGRMSDITLDRLVGRYAIISGRKLDESFSEMIVFPLLTGFSDKPLDNPLEK